MTRINQDTILARSPYGAADVALAHNKRIIELKKRIHNTEEHVKRLDAELMKHHAKTELHKIERKRKRLIEEVEDMYKRLDEIGGM